MKNDLPKRAQSFIASKADGGRIEMKGDFSI
jgi:hypothetical protein